MKSLQSLKIALVYDRVNTPFGGAEKLLLALHEILPQAPLYTSVYDEKKASWAKVFTVVPSFLNRYEWLRGRHQLLAFLMPLAFESFDFSDFDLVISVTSAEAKGIITKPETTHLCYLLTPPRYLYSHREFYEKNSLWLNLPMVGFLAKKLLDYLTAWDQIAIRRPDKIIPISKLVGERVKKYYGLAPEPPLYPTIASRVKLYAGDQSAGYLLLVSRLVPYKNIDLAIQACQELEQPLVIVGQGESAGSLKMLITKPDLIKIHTQVSSAKLDNFYRHAEAILMPGEEDFGLVAIEALAYGKPVIIDDRSGASELVVTGKTGILIKKHDVEGIKAAILEAKQADFDPAIMKLTLSQNNLETFKKQFSQALNYVL